MTRNSTDNLRPRRRLGVLMDEPIPTGPDFFRDATSEVTDAFDTQDMGTRIAALLSALVDIHRANTAALVMIAETMGDYPPYEIDAWREVIPRPPLKECKGKEVRRPACAERHTEDCDYAEPPPEPKHELLPVGTRVLVSDLVYNDETRKPERTNPQAGRITGYAAGNSKYRWQYETSPGRYLSYEQFAFADNRVEVHPDGPECPPPPQPVKREPTGPRVYVENRRGKQGYILEVLHIEKDNSLWYRVQFFTPGAEPTLKRADSLTVVAPSQVERCPNGQTRDECGSGENQCEPCRQAQDVEADVTETDMGLR